MTNSNDFAFATPDSGTEFSTTWEGQHGLTKREHFAAMAMQGFTSNHSWNEAHGEWNEYADRLADGAVKIADALMKRLNEK